MSKAAKLVFICLGALVVSSCASTSSPTLYPNETYQKMGAVQADVDRQTCMALADNYVKEPNRFGEMAKSGAIGAGVGAGAGALSGVIMKGQVGRATAAGAAVGSIVGIVSELRQQGNHSPSYERFVEHCLHKKGYEVIGWQ